MEKSELSDLKKEIKQSTREARRARKRLKVPKSRLSKAESNWETLISLGNEISDKIDVGAPG